MQAANFNSISQLVSSHLELIGRQLTLSLRKFYTHTSSENTPKGLATLLKLFLKLQDENHKSLNDVIKVMLRQLDVAWLSPKESQTDELLQIISIFVSCSNKKVDSIRESPKKDQAKGKMTRFIQAWKYTKAIEANLDSDDVTCPQEGFHEPSSDENCDDAVPDENDETIVPERVKFLRDTIEHCRHFISMVARPKWQLLSMQIVAEAILQLEMQQ